MLQICSKQGEATEMKERSRVAYDFLDVIHEVGKCDERKLSFEMGILAQMASRVTGFHATD